MGRLYNILTSKKSSSLIEACVKVRSFGLAFHKRKLVEILPEWPFERLPRCLPKYQKETYQWCS